MDFMEAIKAMKKGYKVSRINKDWLNSADYVRLGVSEEYNPKCLSFYQYGRWQRNMVFWIEDYLADDWEIVKC